MSHGNPEGVLSGARIPGKHIELEASSSQNARFDRHMYRAVTDISSIVQRCLVKSLMSLSSLFFSPFFCLFKFYLFVMSYGKMCVAYHRSRQRDQFHKRVWKTDRT